MFSTDCSRQSWESGVFDNRPSQVHDESQDKTWHGGNTYKAIFCQSISPNAWRCVRVCTQLKGQTLSSERGFAQQPIKNRPSLALWVSPRTPMVKKLHVFGLVLCHNNLVNRQNPNHVVTMYVICHLATCWLGTKFAKSRVDARSLRVMLLQLHDMNCTITQGKLKTAATLQFGKNACINAYVAVNFWQRKESTHLLVGRLLAPPKSDFWHCDIDDVHGSQKSLLHRDAFASRDLANYSQLQNLTASIGDDASIPLQSNAMVNDVVRLSRLANGLGAEVSASLHRSIDGQLLAQKLSVVDLAQHFKPKKNVAHGVAQTPSKPEGHFHALLTFLPLQLCDNSRHISPINMFANFCYRCFCLYIPKT